MEQNKKGGRRIGAGRKPVDNPKEQVTLYVPKKSIWLFGNKEKLKTALYGFIEAKREDDPKVQVQDLTRPTHEIKAYEQPKTNFAVNTIPPTVAPILSEFDAYKAEILKCRTIPEIEFVMKRVKGALMVYKQKLALEAIAKEHSKTMYSD